MAKKVKVINAEFQIRNIEIIEQHLYIINKPFEKIVSYNFDINLEHRVDIENKNVIVNTSVTILKEDEEKLGSFRSLCIFHVSNLDEFIEKETKHINLPHDLLVTFNSVSISTTRGLMFSNFRGTILHSAVLPIVNPAAFVRENPDRFERQD